MSVCARGAEPGSAGFAEPAPAQVQSMEFFWESRAETITELPRVQLVEPRGEQERPDKLGDKAARR
eukprot:CAMPEP_0171219332 /NCGR_PEP_ID=MMETSP0790-20130122/33660_1 /TAXON_ID=2925 /ORGANISM="Alexandrium catenella, Strain OF101" /LENGTH=65 /DNA_ID=CAMNT_0011685177 /DNA_START=82 /DNA_END=276 /DNA_ORIENTATION=-